MSSIGSVITTGWRNGRKPHIIPAIEEICNRFGPIYYLWGPGRAGTTGHHSQGRAVDISILDKGSGPQSTWIDKPGRARTVLGDEIAMYAWENRARLNIDSDSSYIIWNRRIASLASTPDWSWRTYTGSNPHVDHIHISFDLTGVYRAPQTEGGDLAISPEDREAIAQRTAELVWFERLANPKAAPGTTSPHAREYLVSTGNEVDQLKAQLTRIERFLIPPGEGAQKK